MGMLRRCMCVFIGSIVCVCVCVFFVFIGTFCVGVLLMPKAMKNEVVFVPRLSSICYSIFWDSKIKYN